MNCINSIPLHKIKSNLLIGIENHIKGQEIKSENYTLLCDFN